MITINLCKRDPSGKKIPGRTTISGVDAKWVGERAYKYLNDVIKPKTK